MIHIIGHYSNGAVQLGSTDSHGHAYNTRVAFPDCQECKGTGVITTTTQETRRNFRTRVYYTVDVPHETECTACQVRFGSHTAIKQAINNVVTQVKAITNADKRTGIKITDPEYIESFNVSHPLAKEYRRLLKAWWMYIEPTYTPLAKN